MVSSSGSEFQSGWQEHQLIAEKVSKTLDKTFDKDVREIPTSQFYQKLPRAGKDLLRKFDPPGADNCEWSL